MAHVTAKRERSRKPRPAHLGASKRRKPFLRVVEYRRLGQKMLARLDNPKVVADLCWDLKLFFDDGKEHFGVFLLTGANDVRAYHEVAVGSADATVVSPREVFGPAVRELACTRVILVHNHPAGDPQASHDDVKLTRDLVRAGRLLDVHVIDHVILGKPGEFSSMAQDGFIVDEAHKDVKARVAPSSGGD